MIPLLDIQSTHVSIANTRICDSLSLTVQRGQTWGIMGANGSGKTTLLHTLAGLRKPLAGEITFLGNVLAQWPRRQLAKHLGLLLQQEENGFPNTVFEMALLGRFPHLGFWQWSCAQDEQITMQALRDAQLEDLANRCVDTLSGGEQRRLAFARLFAQSPILFLLDEPVNHLDISHQIHLLDCVIRQAKHRNGAVIMSLHDLNLAQRYCDHFIFLLGKGQSLVGSKEMIFQPENLMQLYDYPIIEISSDKGQAFIPQ
jgi:iron complex transport system ATP-binding protein